MQNTEKIGFSFEILGLNAALCVFTCCLGKRTPDQPRADAGVRVYIYGTEYNDYVTVEKREAVS